MLVAIPVNVLQRDPAFWGKDADVFRPNRWLERTNGSLLQIGGQDLLTFSAGSVSDRVPCDGAFNDLCSNSPRSCIGKSFATAEIKVSLLSVIDHVSPIHAPCTFSV